MYELTLIISIWFLSTVMNTKSQRMRIRKILKRIRKSI